MVSTEIIDGTVGLDDITREMELLNGRSSGTDSRGERKNLLEVPQPRPCGGGSNV
jgi:hypothetical protein